MQRLFSPAGERAMREIIQRRPLLALDFDGTLAPIVSNPGDARAPQEVSRLLTPLGSFFPVAIVTGRSVADVSGRLGFNPRFIVGNHGAEGLPADGGLHADITPWRERILRDFKARLDAAGVQVEDKDYSLSLHYRQAHDPHAARDLIHAAIRSLEPAPRVIGGKFVVNLLPGNAPDKFDAVHSLLRISGCSSAIFAGDDVTDDIVFEKAPADWLTVRVEALPTSRARFMLAEQGDVPRFLRRLLEIAGEVVTP
ncbi:MAG: trehalose-phosphatase [Candidatus Dactylopiibacterium sp.]|nr:trehalose-phosphatase [Candidatus Dactylopiibacterium sp.]